MQHIANEKNVQYEYIRAFAIISVIVIHTFNSAIVLFENDVSVWESTAYNCIINAMWWAVPCFLMLSGVLLLNSQKRISMKKIYSKYVLRMLVILSTFGWGFAWLEMFFQSRTISVKEIAYSFVNVLSGNTWAHMWYVYCLIGLYVLLPVFKVIVDNASNNELKYILGIWFVIGSFTHVVESYNIEFGGYFHINTIYPFWFLMGAAHNRKLLKWRRRDAVLAFVVASCILVISTVMETLLQISLDIIWGYSSVVVGIQAVALFDIIINTKINKRRVQKWLIEIADKSFGIYIVHMIFINFIYKVCEFNPFSISGAIFCGIFLAGVNLVSSYILVCILRKMPFIKKYI